jgi:hypothetical protein
MNFKKQTPFAANLCELRLLWGLKGFLRNLVRIVNLQD